MTARCRAGVGRFVAVALSLCLFAVERPQLASGGIDPDDVVGPTGQPLPRPDSPGEAIAFRQLQWRDEHGWFPENGLVEARSHARAMRASRRGRLFPSGRGVDPASSPALPPKPPRGGHLPASSA